MVYQRKTRDRWDIMTNWGYGWGARTANIPGLMQREALESTGRILQEEQMSGWKSITNR